MIPIRGEDASTPQSELADMGRAAGLDCAHAPTLEEAMDELTPSLLRRPCRLLIAGSLYLAGNILRKNS